MQKASPPMTRRRAALALAVGLWILAIVTSVWLYHMRVPTGDGFTRGMNRAIGFLGWQMLAAGLSLPVLWIGDGFPAGSGLRRISRIPFVYALLFLTALAGLIVWVLIA